MRVSRGMHDYRRNFDDEIQSASALCTALARLDRTFSIQWSILDLAVSNEYGSQLRWRTAPSFTRVEMSREILLELRSRNAPASAYPGYWTLFSSKVGPPEKVGPPDYVYFESVPGNAIRSERDGR